MIREIEPLIRITRLSYAYHPGGETEVVALDGIDLDIRRGEFVAIVGPNGSGKSTLAKHLNALLLPTSGQVEVAGLLTSSPENLWEIRRRVGMVFQNPDNQLVATSVEEDVAFGPENLGVPRDEIGRRIDVALGAVEMLAFRDHAPHLLSGGQKQRVAIAGVLAMKPECLVLDEATAMLDPQGRAEVMDTVTRLNQNEGMTVVHITHYMEETVHADRILAMDRGRMLLGGSPREVFGRAGEIRRLGLDLPQVTELAELLRADGIELPPAVLTVDEMVDALCRFL